jgi:maleate cis-trans isomerase
MVGVEGHLKTRVGILYPTYAGESDYYDAQPILSIDGLEIVVAHTEVTQDLHREDALRETGDILRLLEGAERLREYGELDSIMWACTSGSFVFGLEGARRQVYKLEEETGVPASSTSLAFVEALAHLRVARVSIACTYPSDVSQMFVEFLAEAGIETTGMASAQILTGSEVGRLDRETAEVLIRSAVPSADVVLVPDTALHSIAWLDEVERAAPYVILTANQVTIWMGLRLAGHRRSHEGLGELFRAPQG